MFYLGLVLVKWVLFILALWNTPKLERKSTINFFLVLELRFLSSEIFDLYLTELFHLLYNLNQMLKY